MDEHATTGDLERRLAAAEAALRAKADVEVVLRQSEELRRIAIEGGRMGTWRWDLRDELIRGDAAFLSLWGFPPSDEPRRLSDFADRMSPQGRTEMGEMAARAVTAGEDFDGQLQVMSGPTRGHWVRWRGRAERERPWIVNGVSFDVTEQQLKDERLSESEARHRLLIGSLAQALWETDAAGVVTADSASWRAYTGQTQEEWLGYGWLDAIHPDDRAYAEQQWREATAAHGLVNAEFRLRAPDGRWRWTNICAAPVLDAKGRIEKWAGMNIDIDARKQAEAALRASEALFRQFAETSSDVLWIRNAETLKLEYLSPAFDRIYGRSREPMFTGDDVSSWLSLVHPEDRERVLSGLSRACTGTAVTYQFRVYGSDEAGTRWVESTAFPLFDDAGRVQRVGGIAKDITEQKASAARLEVLVNELQHRARNLLGVVTAVADRTLKQGGSVDAFEERLQALSRAQGLLSQGGDDTVEVGALVRAELAAYAEEAFPNVAIAGPVVRLKARQVQNFALALHELTTNAVKYGALKDGLGQLAVTWEVVLDRRERRRLALSWVESGVDLHQAEKPRRGYGTELIQEALAYALEAKVDYELGTDGVRCRIEMPVA
jgi:PAS domain S-box-containing protein